MRGLMRNLSPPLLLVASSSGVPFALVPSVVGARPSIHCDEGYT